MARARQTIHAPGRGAKRQTSSDISRFRSLPAPPLLPSPTPALIGSQSAGNCLSGDLGNRLSANLRDRSSPSLRLCGADPLHLPTPSPPQPHPAVVGWLSAGLRKRPPQETGCQQSRKSAIGHLINRLSSSVQLCGWVSSWLKRTVPSSTFSCWSLAGNYGERSGAKAALHHGLWP